MKRILIQLIVRSVLMIFQITPHHIERVIRDKVLGFENWNQQCDRFGHLLLVMMPKDHEQ
jgi:hypothetical protein